MAPLFGDQPAVVRNRFVDRPIEPHASIGYPTALPDIALHVPSLLRDSNPLGITYIAKYKLSRNHDYLALCVRCGINPAIE
jgi:hypothetical protein